MDFKLYFVPSYICQNVAPQAPIFWTIWDTFGGTRVAVTVAVTVTVTVAVTAVSTKKAHLSEKYPQLFHTKNRNLFALDLMAHVSSLPLFTH